MEIAIVAVVVLLAGLALGWFAGSRGVAAAGAEREAIDGRLREAERGLAPAE